MIFTEEQFNDIESLAALNYTVNQIAMFLDLDPQIIIDEYQDEDSEFRYHYTRGQLVAQVEIDKKTLESAKSGNITAQQRYDKKVRDNRLHQAKQRIFGRD